MPLSPQKGKAREKQNWQAGWWDFQPLAERSLRPIEWSQSSVIFCAHPVQPLVTARHFSSSKQFVIPSPTLIISSPASYGPPTVISVAPGEDWLFAYFPGRNVDGIGCLWARGSQIDVWNIKEWWNLAQGAGVVAASWLGTPREWVVAFIGSPTRLPPRGPRTPVSGPTLLIVTQDHLVTICYFRHYISSLKFISSSIAQLAMASEGQPHPGGDLGINGIKQCFKATIGLGYNESSILIATRSRYVPPPNSQFSTNSKAPGELIQSSFPEFCALEWEDWGEERSVDLCEIQLRYNGATMILRAEPLPPILDCSATLVDLKLLNVPPSLDIQKSPSQQRLGFSEKGHFYLVSSYLDFDDYTSLPRSELIIHSVMRQQVPQGANPPKSTWKIHKNAARSFSPSVVTYISRSVIQSPSGQHHIYAGVVHTSRALSKNPSKLKKGSVGMIRVLNLSDLADSEHYEPEPILSDVERLGQDMPLDGALSPNGALLSTISSSLWPARTAVHVLPRLRNANDSSRKQIPPLASALASAVIACRPATDVIHALCHASVPISNIFETLDYTYNILDGHLGGLSTSPTLELLGTILAIYRARSLVTNGNRDHVAERWETARDMCSLAACNAAFEDCQEGGTYDLDAVWQLVGLATWIVSFTERLLKACVLSDNTISDVKKEARDTMLSADLVMVGPPFDTPILVHLGHPFALKNFVTAIGHVQNFRAYIGSLSARGENAQIARDVLVDLVDSSGVNFAALKTVLLPSLEETRTLDSESCRRALITCQPSPAMITQISKVIHNVTRITVIIKPILFIKPCDLVDGIGRFAMAKKDKEKDVISKHTLTGLKPSMTCLQCGGESMLSKELDIAETVSPKWHAWEKMWMQHCICGGHWIGNGD